MDSVRVTNLGKAYKEYVTGWARLAEWVSPFSRSRHQLKWVLRDVNFSIQNGEAVGIIGVNGAGKTTLLKMITGTTQPTTGSVKLVGNVAALLELGMGFHPYFTGRQNVFMSGQLLGLSGDEISQLLPAMEDFAEIGDYLDHPVRVYSSGMQVRLAFSVATAKRPDVLIVDEALSVGDAYFQYKSFDRIRQFRKAGTTLLLVSHDKQAILNICDRAILLDGGRVLKEGDPESVMDFYNALLANHQDQTIRQEEAEDGRTRTFSGTGEARVEEIGLYNARGEKVELIGVGDSIELRVKVSVKADLPELVLGYLIRDRLGQAVFGTNTYHLNAKLENVKQGERFTYRCFFQANFGVGSYSVTAALHAFYTHIAANFDWRDRALVFNVVNKNQDNFTGIAWIPTRLVCSRD
jgi:lipopolysaccharide transport system ATP-binding protein